MSLVVESAHHFCGALLALSVLTRHPNILIKVSASVTRTELEAQMGLFAVASIAQPVIQTNKRREPLVQRVKMVSLFSRTEVVNVLENSIMVFVLRTPAPTTLSSIPS